MSVSQIKLTYFPFGGRALPMRLALHMAGTRLTLHMAGLTFTDERIAFEDWDRVNDDRVRFPLGALPVLEVDGRRYCESAALSQYVGEITGLGGKDAKDRLAIAQALLTIEEMSTGEDGINATSFLPDDKKKEARQRFVEVNLRFHLARLEKLLEESGTGYFASSLSIADLTLLGVYASLTSGQLDHVPATEVDAFPKVKALALKLRALPAVQQYAAQHPSDLPPAAA